MRMYFSTGLHGSCGSKQSTTMQNGWRSRAASSVSIASVNTRAAQVSSSRTPAPELARYSRMPGT